MKKKTSRWGCIVWVLLILLLAASAGTGWWFYRPRSLTFDGANRSPVVVTITSPASGNDVDAGNFVPVSVQAAAPESIQNLELFLDGQSLGKVTDSTSAASWTWQAWPLGIHSFYAQAVDAKGQIGYSQVVIVNVLAGDGTMDVIAAEGQTLEQIGADYGVPPEQMAGANPKLPASQPLPGGNPVQVPITNTEPPNTPGGNLISIKWKIKITQSVDKFYCYVSTSNGIWEKLPKGSFNYFYGQENFYTQLIPSKGQSNIQMQCWGWVGGVLKYLGQGEKILDATKTQGEVTISTTGFIFTGFFKVPTTEPPKPLGGKLVPPPFALREASNATECAAYGDPIAVPLLCNGVMNAKVKENIVLVWEWQPEVCWPGFCKYGANKIKGYGLYEIDQANQSFVLIANIKSSAMRVAFPPIPWGGGKCFGVEAYIDYPGSQVSAMDTYCPGEPPKAQKLTLTPSQWLTTGGQWIQAGDCDDYGGADHYQFVNQKKGFGNQPGQVLVGSYLVDDDDCYREGDYSGAVKFDLQLKIPSNATVQKAELVFLRLSIDYGATGLAAPAPSSCVKTVGKSKQEWTGLSGSNHYSSKNFLSGSSYFSPITSISPYSALTSDVTFAVKDWLKTPAKNFGLIFTPVGAPHPYDDGAGSCISELGNFQLNVYYFVQP